MTDSTWSDLENSTIRLGTMHTSPQIAIEQLGNRDVMTADLLGLIRDSLGDEIGRLEAVWVGMRQEGRQQANPRIVKG